MMYATLPAGLGLRGLHVPDVAGPVDAVAVVVADHGDLAARAVVVTVHERVRFDVLEVPQGVALLRPAAALVGPVRLAPSR